MTVYGNIDLTYDTDAELDCIESTNYSDSVNNQYISDSQTDFLDNNNMIRTNTENVSDVGISSVINSIIRENAGQMSSSVNYYSNIPEGIVGFGESKVHFVFNNEYFQLEFLGSNQVIPEGVGDLQGYSNYFYGNESLTRVKHYNSVVYPNLYDGITLEYRITPEGLKYAFRLDPHADYRLIKMNYTGVDELIITPKQVTLTIAEQKIVDDSLEVWYDETGEGIECSFKETRVQGGKSGEKSELIIQFALDRNYDCSKTIVIDPLLYSTFIGGSDTDVVAALAIDSDNSTYVTGHTTSSNFPTENANDSTFGGIKDVFVCKLSADGSTLIYSTFIGGIDNDHGYAIALDNNNNAYITGYAFSDFPTINAFDSTHNGESDVFVSKISADGSILLYSTFIGGNDTEYGRVIALDNENNAYISGPTYSGDFPSVNANDSTHNGDYDVFACKLSADGLTLLYSTFIGGSADEYSGGIALDNDNNAYITGRTYSSDFPTVNAYDSTHNGSVDVFVCKLSADGSILLYSTFIGGSAEDYGGGIALDNDNNAYITGSTNSIDFPTVNAYDSTQDGGLNVFVSRLSADGSTLIYSTFISANDVNNDDRGYAIALDNDKNVYITGYTASSDFPTVNTDDSTYNGGNSDVIVCKLSADGSTLFYSTFIGGSDSDCGHAIALDDDNNIYIGGYTYSSDFPDVNAYDSTFNSVIDSFVFKIQVNY